jgi:two-component system chemotaxis response regulator CheB
MDGLDVLRQLMRDHPRPVVMLSAGGTDGGADATMRALELGAVEFVRKPSGAISLDLEDVSEELLAALRAAACTNLETLPRTLPPVAALSGALLGVRLDDGVAATQIVCIAASTGGPAALARVIPKLPRFARTAVVIVQHMPAGFTASLASRLHGASRLSVREARNGDPLLAGHAYVAPGGYHVRVAMTQGTPSLFLDCGAPEWGVRPAADPMFKSASASFGGAAIGVVLTGMGRDGAEGLATVRRGGGVGVIQHRESAVIAGMPDAALKLAGAEHVVMLDNVAATIVHVARPHESRDTAASSSDDINRVMHHVASRSVRT